MTQNRIRAKKNSHIIALGIKKYISADQSADPILRDGLFSVTSLKHYPYVANAQRLNVLFICTGNSARSILAEAISNYPLVSGGKFTAFSAGSHPKGEVHPLAIDVLNEQRMRIEGLRSKSWEEFAAPGAPQMHVVITVCDQAAGEVCPVWPGRPMTAHWGLPDPAAASGSDDDRRHAFREAFFTLKRRVELMASLPIDTLSQLALKEQLTRIGSEPSEAEHPRT